MPPLSLLHQLLCEGEGWTEQERWGIGATTGVIGRLDRALAALDGLTGEHDILIDAQVVRNVKAS